MTLQAQNANPVELVRKLFDLFGDGLLDQTFALMSPDVVLVEPGDPARLPWAGVFHGHEGLQRFYDGLSAGLSEITIEKQGLRILRVDDATVLVLGTERAVSATTHRAYSSSSAWLWELRHGKICRLTAFHDTGAMENAMRPTTRNDS